MSLKLNYHYYYYRLFVMHFMRSVIRGKCSFEHEMKINEMKFFSQLYNMSLKC